MFQLHEIYIIYDCHFYATGNHSVSAIKVIHLSALYAIEGFPSFAAEVAKYHAEELHGKPDVVVSDQNVSYRDDTSSDSDDSGLEGVV